MSRLRVKIAFVYLSISLLHMGHAHERKIVHGVVSDVAKFPYMVALFYFDTFICSGTIIAERMVLTAGHCVCEDYTTPETVKVYAGQTYLDQETTKNYTIVNITCHDQLSIEHHNNDLAVIKVSEKFCEKGMERIPVIAGGVAIPVGSKCDIVGWGLTDENQEDHRPILNRAQVPISDLGECKSAYRKINVTVTDSMMCAGYPDGYTDTCHGDSGGPLIFKGVQVGVVAFGKKCGEAGYPGVYTDLTKYSAWILHTIKCI